MSDVTCEFRLICGAHSDSDRFLVRAALPAVPAVGEVVNINGAPCVVHERGWSFAADTTFTPDGAPAKLHCFVRVCSLQTAPHKSMAPR